MTSLTCVAETVHRGTNRLEALRKIVLPLNDFFLLQILGGLETWLVRGEHDRVPGVLINGSCTTVWLSLGMKPGSASEPIW